MGKTLRWVIPRSRPLLERKASWDEDEDDLVAAATDKRNDSLTR
jgi:hypothetical protein